jgi:microsomal dipeptidase-like Zn-dependent dipeptidase
VRWASLGFFRQVEPQCCKDAGFSPLSDTSGEHVRHVDYDPSTGPALDEATSAKYWPARQYPATIKDESLSPSILPQVSEQLRSLGYKEASIRAIMGENFMRVASQVWAR